MAVRLSKVFGGSAESRLVRQARYDLAHVGADRIKLKRLEIEAVALPQLSSRPIDQETNLSIIIETLLMADIDLTQDEADKLMAMEKRAVDKTELLFPAPGDNLAIPLTSLDKRESFMLDVTRAQIKLTKATYQNRATVAIILMRLDLDGPPHRNPDGAEISCPHLHIYREGFGDKWAIPAPHATYTNPLDLFSTFEAFMQQCNITDPPKIQKGLFS